LAKTVFGPTIVAVSEPYFDDCSWYYLFGDEENFEFRKFNTSGDAYNSYQITVMGLTLGSAAIVIRIIKLDANQARNIREKNSYREIIASRL
jgi:hypothetical protein